MKIQKFLNHRDLKLLNEIDNIFYQIFNQIKAKIKKHFYNSKTIR